MAMESSSLTQSPREIFLVLTVVCCILLHSLSNTGTAAMPMKDVIEKAIAESEELGQHHNIHKRAVNRTACTRPSNVDLDRLFQEMNSQLDINTQFLQPAINNQAISIPAGDTWTTTRADENEATGCPKNLTRDDTASLAHRSLCPYYFIIWDLPQGYYPSTLKAARCKCQRCVENTALACEAVYTRVAVLKPVGCFQGMQKFQEELINIKTACACAYKGSIAKDPPTATTTTGTTTPAWGVQ